MIDPTPPVLADVFRAWLATSDQESAFFFWLAAPAQESIRRALMDGVRAEVVPSPDDPTAIDPIFLIGPIQEQPVGGPVQAPGRVSSTKGRILVMLALGSSQQVLVSCRFRDRRGNPAPVEGLPEWMTDNSELLALFPGEDGLSCLVKAVGPLGTAHVTLTADADLGAGTKPIIGTLEVAVTAGSAVVVTLEAGTPEDQPEEPPAPEEPTGTTVPEPATT